MNRSSDPQPNPSLPDENALNIQSKWLAPARSRLLRRIGIAHHDRILDLGCGYGTISAELARRCNGQIFALDNSWLAVSKVKREIRILPILGDSFHLPFAGNSVDLVFCQFSLLWMVPAESVLRECHRVLEPGGDFIAIEPDFGGMIEYPLEISSKDVWLSALERNGADPLIGRQLPAILERQGFEFSILFNDRLEKPRSDRFVFLNDLKLMPDEIKILETAKQRSVKMRGWQHTAHLPLFLVEAKKKNSAS